MKNKLHQKIKELQFRSKPINWFSIPEDRINELQTRAAKIQSETGQTVAYFCIWGVRDSKGTGWVRGAFSKSIKERGPLSAASQKIVIIWQHDICDPIGRPVKIVEDEIGAYVIIDWDDPEAVPNSKRAQSQIDSKTLNQWSFGFDYVWDKMSYDELTDTVWIKEADLYEISPVTIASLKETFTVRNKDEYESTKLLLDEETVHVLSNLSRKKQLEVRQLITKHITLAQIEPDSFDMIKEKTLKKRNKKSKPVQSIWKELNKQLS
jgi:HK97 family phage prohead protease